MRFTTILFASSLLISTVTACGHKPAPASTTTQRNQPAEKMAGMCPVEVPGTSVVAEDTATGGALVFMTTGDVAEVRRRVAAMAVMHNQHQAEMAANGGDMAGMKHGDMAGMKHGDMAGMNHGGMAGMNHGGMAGMNHGDMAGMDHAGMMAMMNSPVAPTDVDGGARLTFTAAPAAVAALQTELREHAQHLASGTCMMHGGADAEAKHHHD